MSTGYGPHDQDGDQLRPSDEQQYDPRQYDPRQYDPRQYEPRQSGGRQHEAQEYGAQQYGGAQPGERPPFRTQDSSGAQAPYGIPAPYGAPPPPPPPPPPAWYGFGPEQSGPVRHAAERRRPHRKAAFVAAGITAVALAAGGTAWATVGSGTAPLSTAAIAAQTDPGLVDITSTLGYQHATAEGTGMVLTSNGEILTNNHVVDGATSIKVRDIGNDRTYIAKVVGYNDSDDVAVIQLVGASGLKTVSIGDSGSVSVGQKIVALGNAEGKGGTPSVVTGTVTGTGATITAQDEGDGQLEHLDDMIRTNAAIEPGDSGGPLLNSAGQVVGMDTAASSSNSSGYGTTAASTTTAFSIPINKAITIAKQIEAGDSSSTVHIGETAFLGVEVSSQTADSGATASGVAVAGVVQGGAAASAGLTEGDTILAVGGHHISSSDDLQQVIEGYHPGNKVTVEWSNQAGQTQSATATLTVGPTG
jgi:S1-C subfamily serine protease